VLTAEYYFKSKPKAVGIIFLRRVFM